MSGPKCDPDKYKLDPAKQHLVLNNQKLVSQVIKEHFSVYYDYYDDMFQEGVIGLIKACAKYREEGPAKFSSYAYFCIKNEIQKFVSERTDNVKVPVTVRMCINKFDKLGVAVDEIDVTVHKELLKKYQTTVPAIKSGKQMSSVASLDKPLEDATELTLSDVIMDPHSDIAIRDYEEDVSIITREFVCNLHNWLNFNFPDDLLENRIYTNYIYWYDRESTMSKRLSRVCKELNITRTVVKGILPIYNNRFRQFIKEQRR